MRPDVPAGTTKGNKQRQSRVYGAIGFLGTTAVFVLGMKGKALWAVLAFLTTVVTMAGYAVLQSGAVT